MRRELVKMLCDYYTVITKDSGESAWELVSSLSVKPKLALVDMVMPGITGVEFALRVKNHPDPEVHLMYVILFSSESDLKVRLDALQSGADDYILKTVKREELVARIQVGLRQQRQAMVLHELNQKLRLQLQFLESASLRDPLTGALNRRAFDMSYESTYRSALSDFAFLICDLDHFKQINDTYGHLVGDKVLVTFVRRVQNRFGHQVSFYRYGGEEFVAFAELNAAAAEQLAAGIVQATQGDPFTFDDLRLSVTVSVGCLVTRAGCLTPEELLQVADQLLYRAKRSRNCYVLEVVLEKL